MAALAGGLLALPQLASACSCVALQPAEYLQQADAVFTGTVEAIDIRQPPGGSLLDRTYRARVRVERIYKGNVGQSAVVETGEGGGLCGFSFTVGRTYLVYAKGTANNALTTNLCAGTTDLANASSHLASLGEGRLAQPPVAPPAAPPSPHPEQMLALGIRAAGVFGALAVLVHLLMLDYPKKKAL